MWPFRAIWKHFQEKQLNRECLHEIIKAALQTGITIDADSFTTEAHHNPGVPYLADFRRRGAPYSIRFFVCSDLYDFTTGKVVRPTPVPEGFITSPIGLTGDPGFEQKWAMYSRDVAGLNIRLRSVRDAKRKMWQEVTTDEWERRNLERGRSCPRCNGNGEVGTGRCRTISAGFHVMEADGQPEMQTCEMCGGEKAVDATKLRQYFEPSEWEDVDPYTYRGHLPKDEDEIIKGFAGRRPSSRVGVYLRIEPKDA